MIVREVRAGSAALLLFIGLLAGCGTESTPPDDTNASPSLRHDTLGEQEVLSETEYLASDAFSNTDEAWGERLAMQCRACHALEAGGRHMIGPALHGFFGQPAGEQSGFAYSPALREASFVWTPRALDAWLADPSGFLPGNRMTYVGLRKADDRRALIAYLLRTTGD